MRVLLLIGVAVFGLIIGSFLTVCIYRLPFGRPKGPPDWEAEEEEASATNLEASSTQEASKEEGSQEGDLHKDEANSTKELSLTYPPRSFCPECKAQLNWFHNIPLFSWLALGGKCAFCKVRIPFRYPLVELLSALFAVLSLLAFGPTVTAAGVYVFCCMLIVISFIDIDYYIIPDVISLPGIGIGLALSLVNQFYPFLGWPFVSGIIESGLGVLFGGGVLYAIAEGYYRIRKREGLGLGDVKLLALTGAFFGLPGALYTMFIGSLLGSVIGILLIIASGKRMTYQLPFGPYLALGTIVYIFAAPLGPPWVFIPGFP
jgi:leader peptidase (prepilin peptidase)/N-methyltransferase